MKIDNPQIESKRLRRRGSSCCEYLNKTWLRCVLLALAGFVARVPALQGQLIWDDQYLARDNPFIKSPLFVLEVFRHHLFLDSYSPHYRPIQNLSLMLDYMLWNGNTFGFHLTNVLLHVGGGLLLYFLLRRLIQSLPVQLEKIDNSLVAFLVAALWLVHPVHSAAVDYISGRADSLAFVFASGGWLLFLKASEVPRLRARCLIYVLAAGSGLVALCSRESACIWFALFLAHLLVSGNYSKRARWIATISCVAVLGVYAGLRQLPSDEAQSHTSAGPPAAVRAVMMLRALGDYTRLMLFPVNLHMERSVFEPAALENQEARKHFIELEYLSLVGVAAVVVATALSLRSGRGRGMRLLGVGWFVIGFLPVSNLFDLNASVAEHWLYLPSVGFVIFLAGCALDLPLRLRPAAVALALTGVAAFGARSFVRSSDWIDPEVFFQQTVNAGGLSCRIGVNLGHAYAAQGKYKEAEIVFRKVLKMQPNYTIARNNLADVLTHLGKGEEAKSMFAYATVQAHTSMKEFPRTWFAALNYARFLSSHGDSAGALAVLDKARIDYPETWELLAARCEILRHQPDLDGAIALIKPFAANHWWHYQCLDGPGPASRRKGRR